MSVWLLFILVILHGCNSAPPLGFLPNIIVFYADDYGWGDIETFGHPQGLTPNIDKLAVEGTKLTAFYSSSPVCSPSRAALLTGRFQTRTGIWPGVFWPDSIGGLPLSEITIAEFLKMNGLNYSTVIAGKWHLGTGGESGEYLPTQQGFDLYTGIPYSHDMPNPPWCWPPNLGCWPATAIDPWNETCPDSNDPTNFDDLSKWDAASIGESLDFKNNINEYKKYPNKISLKYTKCDDKPYEQLGDTDPALPLYWNSDIIQQPVNISMIPSWYTQSVISFINESVHVNKQKFFVYMAFHQTHHPQFASSLFFNTTQRGMFGDAQAEMDYNLGLIMDYIKSIGVDKETFVFFSSDNGPSLMRQTRGGNAGPLKCGKGTTYEGGQRMPAIAWMPGYIKNGKVSRQLGSMLDVLPTIAELVDKPLPTDRYYDGYSMYDWLFKDNGKSKRDTFYYWPKSPNPKTGWQQSLHAVRVNEWKLHWITQGSHCNPPYKDPDCYANQEILKEPILFNLYHDVGEAYPVNISQTFYKNIVQQVNKSWEFIFNTEGLWGTSEINKGQNTTYGPCCHWNCTPWPKCCDCNKINTTYVEFIQSKFSK